MKGRETAHGLVRVLTNEECAAGCPCVVRHPDAGGSCRELADTVVYGLNFCEAHGNEIRKGAEMEENREVAEFFQRFRNPHVPSLPEAIDDELEAAANRYDVDACDDRDYHQALVRAYPEIPGSVREQVDRWSRDEIGGMGTVEDVLLDALATLHKLMGIAYQDGETWLVENLEEMRQAQAARAGYAMRELSPHI